MKKTSPFIITFTAVCIALNYAGANIALFLKLPVYLDTFGTILAKDRKSTRLNSSHLR